MALVLGRKVGEGIAIGDEIKVYLSESRSGRGRFVIEAPAGLTIRRIDQEGVVQTGQRETEPAAL